MSEALLLRIGHAYQQQTDFHLQYPTGVMAASVA